MSSNRKPGSNKKEEERLFLDRALKDLGLCSFKVLDIDHERPDFLIDFDDAGRRVGVEVTGYERKERPGKHFAPREIKAHWEKLRKDLVEYSKDHPDLKHIFGIIDFMNLSRPSKTEMPLPSKDEWNDFFKELECYILTVAPKLGPEIENFPRAHFRFTGPLMGKRYPLMQRYLRGLGLARVGFSRWDWNGCIGSAGTATDEIEDIIKKKAKKVYEDKSDNPSPTKLPLWLVVYGGFDVSMHLMIHGGIDELNGNQDLAATLNRSPFERVLLLADGNTHVWDRGAAWRNVDHNGSSSKRDQ